MRKGIIIRPRNLETLFGVKRIPASNRIRDLLDNIEPSALAPVMDYGIEIARECLINTACRTARCGWR
jgi:hypothetical protein